MGDFGKILEQWEDGRSEPRFGQRAGPEQNNPDQMNAWLDQHPAEDKDADGPTSDRTTRRPNPEKLNKGFKPLPVLLWTSPPSIFPFTPPLLAP